MTSAVTKSFRNILSGSVRGLAPRKNMGQTHAARTIRLIDMLGKNKSCPVIAACRFASSLPAAHVVNTSQGYMNMVARREMRSIPTFDQAAIQDALKNIDLVVYDMAGTTVEEGGLVYVTLRRVMVEDGMQVSEEEMEPWHGARKEQVIEHFARRGVTPEAEIEGQVQRVSAAFEAAISDAYFGNDSRVAPINAGLMNYFDQLKAAGIKIGLDTGYPADIQQGLVKKLGFDKVVDSYISSYDVPQGRPYPYMVHHLMERTGVKDSARVAKMGDSVRDMEEGRNAGCGLVVGVLSGADSAEALFAGGADIVVPAVTDLPVPHAEGDAPLQRKMKNLVATKEALAEDGADTSNVDAMIAKTNQALVAMEAEGRLQRAERQVLAAMEARDTAMAAKHQAEEEFKQLQDMASAAPKGHAAAKGQSANTATEVASTLSSTMLNIRQSATEVGGKVNVDATSMTQLLNQIQLLQDAVLAKPSVRSA